MSLPKEYRSLLKPKSVKTDVGRLIQKSGSLHTVCNEAVCPNRGECFSKGTATFLIMGDICTRNCAFCAVKSGQPDNINPEEINELTEAITSMGLKYAVLTSVTRDDIEDGGAEYFSRVSQALKQSNPALLIEVLVPDFRQDLKHMAKLSISGIDVFNHNLETAERLYSKARGGADYRFSLSMLKEAKRMGFITKTGIMTGVGETENDFEKLFRDIAGAEVDILTIGQYIRPGRENMEVVKYYTQEEFDELGKMVLNAGIKAVQSGVFVRSSYKAHETYKGLVTND